MDAYREIKIYEDSKGVRFDYIFLHRGRALQAGLV